MRNYQQFDLLKYPHFYHIHNYMKFLWLNLRYTIIENINF